MFRDFSWVLVAAVAVGLWMPLAHLDWFQSHEQSTYIVRTIEWAEELRAGHLYPRWAPDLYGGYGSPLFVFYAPAIYGVTGLLTATFLDPFSSLKLVVLTSSVVAGLGVYALVYGQTGQRDGALLGALAYLAAPYRIGDLYVRGDVGEFCCLALLPVVLSLYLAAAREAQPFRARTLAVAAALAHALMIVTHTVLGLWGSVVVGIVVLVRISLLIRRGVWRRGLELAFASACAPGLAAAYVVPAIAYRNVTHASAMIVGYYKPQNQWIASEALFSAQSFLYGTNFMRIGPIIVAAGVVTLAGAVSNFKRARPALGWLLLSLTLAGLSLPGAVAFWEPGRVPLVQFTQFPWRLLGPAALSACLALGVGLAAVTARWGEQLRNGIAIAGGAAFLLFLAWPYVSADPMPRTNIATDPDSIRMNIESTTGADEFLPLAVQTPPKRARSELVAHSKGSKVEFWSSDGSRHSLAIRASTPGAEVQLAIYGFPGWGVHTLAGPGAATLDTDPTGLLRVHLPLSGTYQLEVSYGIPPLAWLGMGVTVLSFLALGAMLFRVLSGFEFDPSRVLRRTVRRDDGVRGFRQAGRALGRQRSRAVS